MLVQLLVLATVSAVLVPPQIEKIRIPIARRLDNQAAGISQTSSTQAQTYSEKSGSVDDITRRPVVRIVVHDRIRGYLNWMQEWFQEASKMQCSTRCLISEDMSPRSQESADVILFHAPTHGKHGLSLPAKKAVGTIFAFVSMEQPKYARYLADRAYLQRSFDLLLTYSQAALYPGTSLPNLPLTYYPLNVVPADAILKPAKSMAQKTGYGTGVTVAVLISNCKKAGAEERTAFLQELMKYVNIHSYGGCLKNREEPVVLSDPAWPIIAQKRARKIVILSNYQYYLAFENSPIDDYVSEKVFEGLLAGAVPVYRGAASISNFMPGDDSFINANGLTARQLADKLIATSADEAVYNSYFAYKSRKLPENFNRLALNSFTHPNVLCRLCEYVHAKKHGRQLTDDYLQRSNRTSPALYTVRWSGGGIRV